MRSARTYVLLCCFVVLLFSPLLPHSAWLEACCLCNILFACSRVSEKEEENMKGKKFSLQRIWQNVAHITSIYASVAKRWLAHVWLLQRLGRVVKLCDCMPIYNLGQGAVISEQNGRMVTGKLFCHKQIMCHGFMGEEK